MAEKRNILIILPDQLRRSAVGCYGGPTDATPNMDALAADGVAFSAACSTMPICVPFRFTLMTGHYAHSRLVPGINWRMSPAEYTLADAFNASGYHTIYIGKWHLAGDMTVAPGQRRRKPRRFVPREYQGRWQTWRGFELTNDHFNSTYFVDADPEPHPIEGYQTDGLTDLTLECLETHQRERTEQPFCCVYSPEPPHPPYEAPQEYVDFWAERDDVFPPNWYCAPPPRFEEHYRIARENESRREQRRQQFLKYFAMVHNLDHNIGRILSYLDDSGLAASTTVVLISDHGDFTGLHKATSKEFPHEVSSGIPFIVREPQGQRGVVCSEVTCSEDLFPTLLGLANVDRADAGKLYGTDLTPLIRGEASETGREGVLLEYVGDHRPENPFFNRPYRAFRTKRFLYAVLADAPDHTRARPWLLYDLEADPLQMHNRIGAPDFRNIAAVLHRRLRERILETGDVFELDAAYDSDPIAYL